MHQSVEAIPVSAEGAEHQGDLRVIGNVAGKGQCRAELGGEAADALLEAFTLIGERKLRALLMA